MSGGRFRVKKRLQVRIRGGDGFNRDLRRVIYPNKVTKPSQCLQMPSASSEPLTDDAPVSSTESKKPQRTYKERRQSEAEMWDGLRSDMLKIRIEGSCPGSSECCLCSAACTNIVFCNDCGPAAYYCEQCCARVHQIVLYHNPCIWKGDMYIPYTIRTSLPLKRMDHDCDSVYSAPVTVFNKSGQQHEVMLEFCRCEKEPVSLLRYKLWPSSPVTPRVAFDIELLEMACALQLDAQLPLKSFCVALKKLKCPFPFLPNFQEKNLYRCLVKDAFAEYRFHRSKYFGDPFPSDADDEKNPCPVCEVADFPPILSMDGNFGLVHKKSAGEGSKMSRQKEKFFFNQEKVDSFVASYCKDKKNPNEECSNFQAGNILRSKKKTDKLDITGIFGSVCHHDIPQKFLNLRHGERLAYPVYLMENFHPSGGESVIMYDIACALHKHLKNVNNQSLLSKFKFVVPVFHSYAHNLKCQLSYGQRFVPGTGLADGEGTERLWSFLRRFSSITKEMSVPNRHDLLVEALLHYTENRISGLGESLERQLAHSRTVKCESQTEYEEIEKQQPGPKPSLVVGTLQGDKEGFMKADTSRMKKYGKVWGTFDGLNPILYIADQDMLRNLFVKQFADFTDRRVFEGFNGDLEQALTNVKGDQWKNLRHLMSPTFSSGKLKRMTPLIVKASKSLTDHFSKAIKTDPQQEMKRCMGGYTMDVIASTAFGINVNSNEDPNDPFVEKASRFLSNDVTSWKLLILFLCPSLAKYLGKFFGVSFFPKDVQKFFRKVIIDTINARSTERADYVDFLQLMMQAHITDEDSGNGEKKGMTIKEILSNALIFFFAGYETTAATLSFLSFELAHNPDIQDKLYQEVMENVGEEEADYDNVSNLPYLDMCINETLRKYPPAIRLDRTCTRDTDLFGLKVPKGMVVNVPIYAIHRSPDLWENPDKFDPDRFLPENKAKMTQFQFIPFGYGPRNCIGMRLALLEAKIAIVAVLKRFRFLVGEKTKLEDNLGAKGLLVPTELWVKMEDR